MAIPPLLLTPSGVLGPTRTPWATSSAVQFHTSSAQLRASRLCTASAPSGRSSLPFRCTTSEPLLRPSSSRLGLSLATAASAGPALQTSAIPASDMAALEQALRSRGFSLRARDVTVATGLSLGRAERALRALAHDALGELRVDGSSDLVYDIPRSWRLTLAAARGKSRVEGAVLASAAAAQHLGRLVFGGALFASLAVVAVSLVALSSAASAQSDRDDRRRSSRASSPYAYGRPGLYFNLGDLLWYWDPWNRRRHALMYEGGAARGAARRGATVQDEKKEMPFLEAIFSFVWGDAGGQEAATSWDDRRWEALAATVSSHGGVVTFEQLAPFLDAPPEQNKDQTSREARVVPALLRLEGQAHVTPEGLLVYVFPFFLRRGRRAQSLGGQAAAAETQRPWTAWVQDLFPRASQRATRASQRALAAPEEPLRVLSRASHSQKVAVLALGAANALGVRWLAHAAAQPGARAMLAEMGLAWVVGLLPLLKLYASSFFVVPAARYLWFARQNAGVARRNALRARAALFLSEVQTAAFPGPDDEVREARQKILSARRLAEHGALLAPLDGGMEAAAVSPQQRSGYSSGAQSASADEIAAAEFDRRLDARARRLRRS